MEPYSFGAMVKLVVIEVEMVRVTTDSNGDGDADADAYELITDQNLPQQLPPPSHPCHNQSQAMYPPC